MHSVSQLGHKINHSNGFFISGYKIETPKLEFGETKNGDYILKPEYHKLTSDYTGAGKSHNDYLLKTSEFAHGGNGGVIKPSSEYPGLTKTGEGYNNEHEAAGYNEKYFHNKQF